MLNGSCGDCESPFLAGALERNGHFGRIKNSVSISISKVKLQANFLYRRDIDGIIPKLADIGEIRIDDRTLSSYSESLSLLKTKTLPNG